MTSARGTQQRIHSGNCDDSNNSQLCSQLASTWGPEHRCLAVVAVDEGAERAVCVEGVAKAILSEIVQMIDPAAALRKKNRASVQTSGRTTLGMRLRSGWALRMRLRSGWAKLHAPGKRKARKPARERHESLPSAVFKRQRRIPSLLLMIAEANQSHLRLPEVGRALLCGLNCLRLHPKRDVGNEPRAELD
ncbi:hypothetical protein Plhal710r2_c030g0114011 [Plasmopara halstedii]